MSDEGQLDLFAEPEPEPDPELERLARRIPTHVRFGTSSWTFRGWRGLVYRGRYKNETDFVRRSLHEYARFPLFDTVGVDRGYYAPIPEADLARYARSSPTASAAASRSGTRSPPASSPTSRATERRRAGRTLTSSTSDCSRSASSGRFAPASARRPGR